MSELSPKQESKIVICVQSVVIFFFLNHSKSSGEHSKLVWGNREFCSGFFSYYRTIKIAIQVWSGNAWGPEVLSRDLWDTFGVYKSFLFQLLLWKLNIFNQSNRLNAEADMRIQPSSIKIFSRYLQKFNFSLCFCFW
jgi:hypothetical protein